MLTVVSMLLAGACVLIGLLLRQLNERTFERDKIQIKYDEVKHYAGAVERDLAVAQASQEQMELRFKELQAQSQIAFKALANDALQQASEQHLQLVSERLKPLNEMLREYNDSYQKIEQSRKQEYGGLKELTHELKDQTSQLSRALRRPEVRGKWGEIALRRIAELSGMTRHCDFTEQKSLEGENGRLQPDMIVRLPSERVIVVDAKTVMQSFLDALTLDDPEQRFEKLVGHASKVHDEVKKLSSKPYLDAVRKRIGRTPDFVVLFVPIESALYAALEVDDTLIERAFEKNVVVASPTLLIALLKAVELGWHEQRIAENAHKLLELGQELHDRIGKSLGDVLKVGASLNRVVKDYNTLAGSLERRVMPSLRKFEDAGARSSREIEPPKKIERQVATDALKKDATEPAESADSAKAEKSKPEDSDANEDAPLWEASNDSAEESADAKQPDQAEQPEQAEAVADTSDAPEVPEAPDASEEAKHAGEDAAESETGTKSGDGSAKSGAGGSSRERRKRRRRRKAKSKAQPQGANS